MAEKLPVEDLYGHVVALSKSQPQKVALVAVDETGLETSRLSYGDLPREMEKAASYLFGLGLTKGDAVALAFKNSPELLVLSWAAWASGIVTVPMDTKRDTGEQYQYKLNLNKAKVLIAQKGALKAIEPKFLEGVRIEELSELPNATGEVDWEKNLKHLALILFTSGTTGHPKGARLSLENLIVNADGIRHWLRFTEADTFLVNLPLHHINSTTFCLSTLLAGGTIAIPPNYSNSNFWNQMAKTGATVTSIVQSILFDQLGREAEFNEVRDQVKLQRIQIGSAPVIAQTVAQFIRKLGISVYQGYGQTETALRVTGVPMDLSDDLYERMIEENCIGTAMPWADVQIADENGKFLEEGEEGEMVVKGPAIMEGYVGGEKTFGEQCDAKGYFLTGDVGTFQIIDGQRFFFLKGRKREIIIKGGVNISPVSVENALKKISDDIEQVHVVAVADDRYGEEAGAVISWKAGIDETRAKRRLKCALLLGTPYISAYETPKYITSMAVADLPSTSTGKVQRSVLKTNLKYEAFESIYGLIKTSEVRFTALHRYSRWLVPAYELYKKCWGDLASEQKQYEKDVQKQLIVMAAKPEDTLLGHVAIIRTNLSERELLETKYADLLTSRLLNPQGKALVCISICSADYEPKPIPEVAAPSDEVVRAYVPNDPVFKFHAKAKGGQSEGAHLVDLIPNGRPEDRSSLGYNMLVKYPEPSESVALTPGASVSQQLIEVALILAADLGIKEVYAYSRPGGLASYLDKMTKNQ